MPIPKDAERMRKAEKEVGENIPTSMIGLDTEDVGDVDVPSRAHADEDDGQ